MKKTEAIRRARDIVPAPISFYPTHFLIRVPADLKHPDGPQTELHAACYLEAQHVRALAIARLALQYMGLGHVSLTKDDGGTVEQLMTKALDRATHGSGESAPLSFWKVRLGSDESLMG